MKQAHHPNRFYFLFVIILLLIGLSACSSEPDEAQPQAEEIAQGVPASATPTSTSVPDEIDDMPSSTNEDVLFILDEAIFRASIDNLTANNGTFLVVTGEVQNQTNSRECVYANEVRLILDGERYAPQNNVMDAFATTLDRDFIVIFDKQRPGEDRSVAFFELFK